MWSLGQEMVMDIKWRWYLKPQAVEDIGQKVISTQVCGHRLVDEINGNVLMVQPKVAKEQLNQGHINSPLGNRH